MYPIEITQADLLNYGISLDGKSQIEIARFLRLVHQTFYEMVIFTTFREWRKKIIENNKEKLRDQIKDILLNIAYEADEAGQVKSTFDGTVRTDTGTYDMKDTQDKFHNALSPLVWNMIFSLEPSLTFCGGEV